MAVLDFSGWSGGRVGGWVAGKPEIITNSAQLGLELGNTKCMCDIIIK